MNAFRSSILPLGIFFIRLSSAFADCSRDPIPPGDPGLSWLQNDFRSIETRMENQELEDRVLKEFLSSLEPCIAYELSTYSYDTESILRSDVVRLASSWKETRGFDRPKGGIGRAYPPLPEHPALAAVFDDLARRMEQNKLKMIRSEHLKANAARIFAELERSKRAPQCYRVHSYHAGIRAQTVALTSTQQDQIEEIFKKAASAKSGSHFNPDALFSDQEYRYLMNGSLSPEELMELKAIRRATSVFGQMTPLRDDIGGWAGNLTAEYIRFKENEANCLGIAMTFQPFIQRLNERGVIQHFEVESSLAYRASSFAWHVGTVLRNRRTGARFVLDPWFDGAGKPGRILSMDDWNDYRDDRNASQVLKSPRTN